MEYWCWLLPRCGSSEASWGVVHGSPLQLFSGLPTGQCCLDLITYESLSSSDILGSSYSDQCHKVPAPPRPFHSPYLSLWCVSSQLKACGNWRGGRQAGLRPFVPARPPSFNDSPEFSGPSSNSLTQHTRPWFLDHCLWNHLRQNCTSSCSSLLTVKVLIKVLGGS